MTVSYIDWMDHPDDAAELAKLRQQFPGWQIWASGPTWCARPWPLINAGSAEELAERLKIAHTSPPDGCPALASWRSYAARRRAFRAFEETAAATWKRMRDEADRWPRFPLRRRADRPAPAATSAAETGTLAGPDGQGPPESIA